MFRAFRRPNPTLDSDGNMDYGLELLFKGYKNQDPPVKQQKALPPFFFRQLYHRGHLSPLLKAVAQLSITAFFFACQSYKYTAAPSTRKTKTLCLRNVQFTIETGAIIPHDNPGIFNAKFVNLTFENQKNSSKFERIPQQNSGDPILVNTWNDGGYIVMYLPE